MKGINLLVSGEGFVEEPPAVAHRFQQVHPGFPSALQQAVQGRRLRVHQVGRSFRGHFRRRRGTK